MSSADQCTFITPILAFRISLLVPPVGLLIYAILLFYWTPAMPEAAAAYDAWWLNQQLTLAEVIQNWLGVLGLILFIVSTAGLITYKPWARISYIFAVLIIILAEIPVLPVLISGYQQLIDNVVTIFIGLTIGVMCFCAEVKNHFQRDEL